MQMNLECIKDVLLYCVNNIKIKKVGNDWKIDKVNLETLYNADELKKYDQIDIMYSVIKLKECHYISIFSCFPENGAILKRCSIDDVTIDGHKFIDSVKEPTIWNKTKSIINKVGNHTLEFVEGVAHDVAVESAKELIKGTITGQP